MSFICKGICCLHKEVSKYNNGLNVQCVVCNLYYKANLVVIASNNGKRCFCCGCYIRKKRRAIGKNVITNRI
jgi:hypothetical protein